MILKKSIAANLGAHALVSVCAVLALIHPSFAPRAAADSTLKPSFDSATGTIHDDRWRSGVPLGGIGNGKIEALTDGSFGNFTNNNNWDRPYGWARGAFAAIRVQTGGDPAVTKVLRLAGKDEYAGVDNVWHTRTQGWFPREQIDFADDNLPLRVQFNAFSPLIPHNIKDSSLPVACLSYTLTNPTSRSVKTSLVLAWPNLLGWGGRLNGSDDHVKGGGTQEWNDLTHNSQIPAKAGDLTGLRYVTDLHYTGNKQDVIGEYFVGVRHEPGVSIETSSWDAADATPSFWAGFAAGGTLTGGASSAAMKEPAGAVSAEVSLAPGETRVLRFYVAWAMPHLVTLRGANEPTVVEPGEETQDRWTTGHAQGGGDSVTVDLQRPVTPERLTLEQGEFVDDYPRGLKVEISSDQQTWTPIAERDQAAIKSALNGATIAVPLSPIRGRYLRLTELGTDSYFWWSIHAMQVVVKDETKPINLALPAKVHSEDVGHYWQRWWRNAAGIVSYADRNVDRLLRETQAWQTSVRESSLPFWLKLKLINCSFPIYSNTILTRDGRFSVLESPVHMSGALGTMDQRMAAHGYYTSFFPELDQAELEMYAVCQQKDGRITHLDGNVHNAIGSPNVVYGITDWPDLASSWVLQVTKLARWTGDTDFLRRMQPHISRAMDFMYEAGKDDDSIPEGGSTYDYEPAPPGAFIYSASCYLGALRAAAVSDPARAEEYRRRLALTQASVMRHLWNGTFFRKYWSPNGKTNENSFVANLAGDWLARLTGLPKTLDPEIIHKSVAQTIARHQKPFNPVPPMEVTPDGKMAVSMCFILQHEPYLGCEAIYENYIDDGLETLHRVYDCAWEINHSPWDQSLMYPAPEGHQSGLVSYMTSTTSWNVLDALGGTSLDIPNGRLYISPRLTTTETELHIPVYFSRFSAWLDYVPAAHHLTLRVLDVVPTNGKTRNGLFHAPGPRGDNSPRTITIRSIARDGDSEPIALPTPFMVGSGAVLDLSGDLDRLALPAKSEVVDFAVKEAPGR